MTDERYTFEQARLRLEEIAAQARKKDTTLEKSLDLLEEGARLALICTELVDHTDFGDTAAVPSDIVPESDDVSDGAHDIPVVAGEDGESEVADGDDTAVSQAAEDDEPSA